MRIKCLWAAIVPLLFCAACRPSLDERAARGAAAMEHYGCGSCHTVGGIPGARGLVGPPLNGIGSRMYVAGMLENTEQNMASWIHDPKAINPKTAMPNLGASEQDAGDMAAFLRTKK